MCEKLNMKAYLDLIMHTQILLQQGIFDHLSDAEKSMIHHQLIYGNENPRGCKSIFRLWRSGNYGIGFEQLQLLQKTNSMLQKFGEQLIDEDFIEQIID